MKKVKRTLKFKKFNMHPILMFVILTGATLVLSAILSGLGVQTTYNTINPNTLELENNLVTIDNLLNYNGLKYIISNAAKNIAGFSPISNLLLSLIGLAVAYSTGLIDTFTKRITLNINNKILTFIIILLATISSLINDVGYVILIPLSAIIFSANKRSPILGIITAFCGVAFGYGATLFVGSTDVSLISNTTLAARIINEIYHVELTSNLYIMIVSTIILSIVGTIIIEKMIAPKFSKVKIKDEDYNTKEIDITKIKETEQNKIELELKEKKGLKKALIVSIIFIVLFAYSLIPNLPFSGLLLDMKETTYLNQAFGKNSYFQDGFTYMISLFFVVTGIVYGINAKTIKNSKDLFEKCTTYLSETGIIFVILFFAAQFIAIFKKSNIGTFIVALSANLIKKASFSGIALIIMCMLVIAVCNIFVTTASTKWAILAPVIVPLMMESNISPQFAQYILRAADSMTKGITPLLAYFAVYIGYLNIYNTDKEAITIKKSIKYIMPYCLIISITWILIIVGWYILGAPIGIGVSSTL